MKRWNAADSHRPGSGWTRSWLFWLLSLCCLSVAAQEPVVLGDGPIRPGPAQLALLGDLPGKMTFRQAAVAFKAGQFETGPKLKINRGTVAGAYWARLVLKNPDDSPRQIILSHEYAPTDDVRAYLQTRDGGHWHESAAGDSRALSGSVSRGRLAAFPITVAANSERAVYLRVATKSNLNFQLAVWPDASYFQSEATISLVYGLLFGAILATVVYLCFAYVLLRYGLALVLAAHLAAYGFYLCFLNGFQWLWLPEFGIHLTNSLHMVSLGLLFFFGALFYRRFLALEVVSPRMDRVVLVLQWLSVVVMMMPLLPMPIVVLALLTVTTPGPLLTISYAFYLWYRKQPQASVFAIGWLVAHLSAILGSLRIAGILPNTSLLLHLPAYGCAIAFAFFAWAISVRLSRERRYAYEDHLTGLGNRRWLEDRFVAEMERARRYGRPLSLLLLDMDDFKRVNDERGHEFGDEVLRALAGRCRLLTRENDVVVRFGGEEFAVLMPETGIVEAEQMAERLRQSQADDPLRGYQTTVSIGVTELGPGDRDLRSLMARADRALYAAKAEGRNRVLVWQPQQSAAAVNSR